MRSLIVSLLFLLLAGHAAAADLAWDSAAGGGVTFATAGKRRLGGTIGQSAAGLSTSGQRILVGGFWALSLAQTAAPTPTPSVSATPTLSPSPIASFTPTRTATPTQPGVTPSATATRTATPTQPGATLSATPTLTASATRTASLVPTSTHTPTPGALTPSQTPSATSGASPSSTPTSAPTASVVPSSTPTPTATATPPRGCVGDCGEDGRVTVEELVTIVRLALETAPPGLCESADPDGDLLVSIDEILIAVEHALGGCPALPLSTRATLRPETPPGRMGVGERR